MGTAGQGNSPGISFGKQVERLRKRLWFVMFRKNRHVWIVNGGPWTVWLQVFSRRGYAPGGGSGARSSSCNRPTRLKFIANTTAAGVSRKMGRTVKTLTTIKTI